MTTVQEVDSKVTSHIDVCCIRYDAIQEQIRAVHARLKRLEQLLISAGGAIILLLLSLVLKGH
jgi:hypothetical protein